MLKKYGIYIAVALFCVCIAALLLLGCRQQQPLVLVERNSDSTAITTTVTQRDTVVAIPGDSAKLALLVRDVEEFGRVLDELRRRAATATGSSNATVTLRVVGDTLYAKAECDSMELRLANAITLINTLTERLRTQETVALMPAEQPDKAPVWMLHALWLVGAIVMATLAIKLTLKYL